MFYSTYGIACLHEDEVHEKPAGPPIPVHEGVDVDQLVVRQGSKPANTHYPWIDRPSDILILNHALPNLTINVNHTAQIPRTPTITNKIKNYERCFPSCLRGKLQKSFHQKSSTIELVNGPQHWI